MTRLNNCKIMLNIVIYTFIASEEDDVVDVYCNSSAKKSHHGNLLEESDSLNSMLNKAHERINELQCQVKELNEKLAAVHSSTPGTMENNISLTDLSNVGTVLLPESNALSTTSKFLIFLIYYIQFVVE